MKVNLALFILLALLAAGCRRTDVRELTIDIPGLNEGNKSKVTEALAKYAGVRQDSYVWDMSAKKLTLKYDSMMVAHTNLRMAIADKGVEVSFPTNTTGRAGY